MRFRAIAFLCLLSAVSFAQTTTTYTGVIRDLSQAVVTSGQVTFELRPSLDSTISGFARFFPSTITCSINQATAGASAAVRAANSVTISGLTGHTFVANDVITVTGMTDSTFNGTFTVGSITATSITYPQTAGNATTGSGVIAALRSTPGPGSCTVTMNTALNPSGSSYRICIQPNFISPGSCFNDYAVVASRDITTIVPTPTTSPAFTFVDLHSAQTIDGNKTFTGSTSFTGSLTMGAISPTSATISGNATVGGTLGVTGAETAASLNLAGTGILSTTAQSGTGSLCMATNCVMVTPAIGAATGTSLALGGGTALTTTNRTGTGNLVLATAPTITNSTQDIINQPAATAFTIKDNQGGTRYSIPSGGVAQGQINNTSLTGANTANNVSVLNAQGAVGPLTGNAADQVVYTYTLPANTIDTTSKGLKVRAACVHTSGTVNTSLNIKVNGVAVVTGATGTTGSQSSSIEVQLLRTGATTAGAFGVAPTNTGNNGTMVSFSQAITGLAWTSNQTVTFTFNAANTDTFTGIMFMVEQIQ